ncbi:MAG TPA: DUF692 domain-containing protein [Micropepsaceae bacterium]|nr:DUF692 domain-containing protein [Micropepsaceae bacterium]
MRPAPHTPQAARQGRSPVPVDAGIGLRFPHQRLVAEQRPATAWFEVHTENYFGGGTRLKHLDQIRRDYPLSLHGTALSLGSAEGLDEAHLKRMAECAARLEPGLISEHLSFSRVDGTYYADLLPLPLTEEALTVVCRNVDAAQDAVKRRLLVENPSTYLQFRHSTIPEWQFLAEVAARTGCGILCDVNNIYVSACNHGWDALSYLDGLPPETIGEIHLAGHAQCTVGDVKLLIDNHGSRVAEPVWDLFDAALRRFGPKPVLIEWDTDIPEFAVLEDEAARAARALRRIPEGQHADAA